MSDVIVTIEDVHKRYARGAGEVHALRGVSLALRAGRITALRGPSGSGKTTVLNLLCGWEMPDEGRIVWADGAPTQGRSWKDLALLPQRLGLFDELTVRENVCLPLRLAPPLDDGRVDSVLTTLGLEALAPRLPHETSLGEQQRAGLARALLPVPRMILADEPTSHQDERSADLVLDALRTAADLGSACLLATHNDEVSAAADEVVHILDGVIRPAP